MRRKLLLLGLALLTAVLCFGCAQKTPDKDLVILYTNDVHCGVDANIGYAGVAAYRNQLEAEGNQVMLVDAGDAVQGDFIGLTSQGEYLVQIMNQMGYDAAIPGNHEFDFTAARFLELAEMAEYPYISANILDIQGNRVLEPYVIKDWCGKKVAFVGVTTPKTLMDSIYGSLTDEDGNYQYDFCQDADGSKLYNAVQEAVDQARKAGADYVIALAHLGVQASTSPWTAGEVIAHTSGIDVLIDGHSHTEIPCNRVKNKDGQWVLHTQTGTKLNYVGMLLITKEGNLSTGLVSELTEQDPQMVSFIEGIEEQFNEQLAQVLAHTDYRLTIEDPETDARIVRNAETNLGDLVADAFRAITGAQIAIENGGGVRSTIEAGDITYGDAIRALAFGNEVYVIEVTGQQLLDALEMSSRSVPEENSDFLHVSGLTYEIDTSVASSVELNQEGQFVAVKGEYRVKQVKIGDEELVLEQTYVLAGNDYVIMNPTGAMTMFKDCKVIQAPGLTDAQTLIQYLTENLAGTVPEAYADPYGQGRIVAVEH